MFDNNVEKDRDMNTQQLLQLGGRIVRQVKGRRTVTIAYHRTDVDGQHNPDGDYLAYGATIFRKESSKDHWSRETERQRAILRLEQSPVVVHAPRDQFEHVAAQDRFIRRCLPEHGCWSHR